MPELDIDNYALLDGDNNTLEILSVEPYGEANQVLITTAAQAASTYRLIYPAPSIPPASGPDDISFDGSTLSEPTLEMVELLDSQRLRLTFSGPMGESAELPSFYTVLPVPAEGTEIDSDPQFLSIDNAQFGDTTAQIILSFSAALPQPLDFRVLVGNVASQSGVLVDPTKNALEFNSDVTPPALVSARAAREFDSGLQLDGVPAALLANIPEGDSAVLVTFSERVGSGADDAANYGLSPSTQIKTVLLTDNATQVLLHTARLFDEQYQLDVSNIEDLRGLAINPQARFTSFDGRPAVDNVDIDRPRVVAAASGGNNTVFVTFSKPMAGNAENAANYSVVQETVNPEVGGVNVLGAAFTDGERLTVELSTSSQNELTYRVKVGGAVTDLGGRPLADQEREVDPTSALFAGIPPGADELVDNDNDGIPDNIETRGYTVTLQLPDGSTETIQVTSDPNSADTDGDGVGDALERQYSSNPRSADTDGDTLSDNLELNTIFSSPFSRDTDGDSLEDGLEHFDLKTSPILADSDGDQLNDDVELFQLNRDPLIADIPLVQIQVGEVRLQIDERYTYVDENGQTVSQDSNTTSTLARSENTSFARSDSGTTEISAGFEVGFEVGNAGAFGAGDAATATLPAGKAFGSANFQHNQTDSWAVESTSAQESQQAYETSLNKGRQFSTTNTVTREIVDARIDVDLSVMNSGSIPFTVSNLEVTVLEPSPIDSSRLVPVATLVANSQLITGTALQINLGGFNNEAGPFLFANREVFPNLVEALMRNARGLVFEVANYDLTDELGRNFVFTNQITRDRTASLVFDYGDAAVAQRHLVAVSGALDDQGITGEAGAYVGGFGGDGRSLGLPLGYLLQTRLGLQRQDNALDVVAPGPNRALDSVVTGDDEIATQDGQNVIAAGADGRLQTQPTGDDIISNPNQPDGIVAGPDKVADSFAQGDDIQEIPPGTTGLSLGSIVVSPGNDGILDTPPRNGDIREFISGYETRNTCSVDAAKVGDTCVYDSECVCAANDDDPRCAADPVPPAGGTCSGPQRLHRVNSLRNGDFNRSWVILTTGEIPAAADFDQIVAKAGDNLSLAFLQDLDNDGLFARSEFLAGSIDSPADRDDNSAFGINFDDNGPGATGSDGVPDSVDTDRDGLGDFAEIRVGWMVAADGGALRQVYSLPFLRDSDGDGLQDPEEQDVSGYCEGPHAAYSLCLNFPPDPEVSQGDAVAILAGANRVADSLAGDTNGDGVVDGSDAASDDVARMVDFDTNGDGTVDGNDRGLGARAIIVTGGPNGQIETAKRADDIYIAVTYVPPALDPAQSDTDMDAVSDRDELQGYAVGLAIVDGGNGIADTVAAPTDVQKSAANNPVLPGGIVVLPGDDGGLDTLPKGDVLFVSGSVRNYQCGPDLVADRVASGDDTQELPPGTRCFNPTSIVIGAGPNNILESPGPDDFLRSAMNVLTDPLRRDTDDDSNSDGREIVLGSDPTVPDGDAFRDSDRDGLSNSDEAVLGWLVSVNGNAGSNVLSSPSLPDTDQDGLPDLIERDIRTNPNKADTDGDGLTDFDEVDDFERYVRLAAPFPALDIQGGASARYGTSPNSTDTDGDGLTDFAELIECARIVLPGATMPARRCTSPVQTDTDLDGISDADELARAAGATDPTNTDTDGDGRSDGAEAGVSDPLVPDVGFNVIFRYITTNDQCGDSTDGLGELAWWFVIYPPGDSAQAVLLSDALDAELLEPAETGTKYLDEDRLGMDIPDNTTQRACYMKNVSSDRSYFLNFNKRSQGFAMKRGESFRIQALIGELDASPTDNCGLPPSFIPTNFSGYQTVTLLDKTYFYDDVASGGGATLTASDGVELGGGEMGCQVDFKLDVEVLGGGPGG